MTSWRSSVTLVENTVYRRINKLERMGIITRRIMAVPNFEKLGLSAVIAGINLDFQDLDKALNLLKKHSQVYGSL